MKKSLLIGLMFLFVAGIVYGNTMQKVGEFPMSNTWKISNITLTSESVVQSFTSFYNVSLNIQAKGGDAQMTKTNQITTEAVWTIGQDQTFWDHFVIPASSGEVFYFHPASSAVTTVEIFQVYR